MFNICLVCIKFYTKCNKLTSITSFIHFNFLLLNKICTTESDYNVNYVTSVKFLYLRIHETIPPDNIIGVTDFPTEVTHYHHGDNVISA